jgi:hypothetical protein
MPHPALELGEKAGMTVPAVDAQTFWLLSVLLLKFMVRPIVGSLNVPVLPRSKWMLDQSFLLDEEASLLIPVVPLLRR